MSSSARQSELFAGEDWKVLYQAFTQINFNASDPPSIAKALREYLQTNYPEDFNDWIESSEFIFILELIAWVAGTLAFKTDINSRENFLETAEARESILRLARFLSYNPHRNQTARGLVKIVEVSTDDDVVDSSGINLNNTTVVWNDQDDPDWQERFTLILNNAFVQNNQFGQPLQSAVIANANTQLYRVNNLASLMTTSFSTMTNGEQMSFEVCNGDFDETTGFFERAPSMETAFHLYYRADGNGYASNNTGFFMLFKQGSMDKQTFNIPTPIENQLINIEVTGINDSDVWVQTVDDTGAVTIDWTKVPAIFSDNITYTSISSTIPNIFSVVTRDEDRISIRFSDGQFGAAPSGNIRVWYRTSNGLSYQIRPQDIDRIKIAVPFVNRSGVSRTLNLTFSLQESVSNSAPRETDDQIRRRAPTVYATQNRMVSGEDYNTFPLQSNVAVKMKAVNRVYSGHSRFIDLNDPTGTYQDTNVFSDDGLFYKERKDSYVEIPLALNRTSAELLANYIQPALETTETTNYALDTILVNAMQTPPGLIWRQASTARFSSTGYFTISASYLTAGTMLRYVDAMGDERWVSIASIDGAMTIAPLAGFKGPVTLSETIPDNSLITAVVPAYQATLDGDTTAAIAAKLDNSFSFSVWYDMLASQWSVREPTTTTGGISGNLVHMLDATYLSSSLWRIVAPGIRYIFSSENNVQWYFNGSKAVDSASGLSVQDLVRVLSFNQDLTLNGASAGLAMSQDYDLTIDKLITSSDGYANPTLVSVEFIDSDNDGVPDVPDTFYKIVGYVNGAPAKTSHLFWTRDATTDLYSPDLTASIYVFEREQDRIGSSLPNGSVAFQMTGTEVVRNETFWVMTSGTWVLATSGYKHAIGRGRNIAGYWITSGTTTPIPITDTTRWINFQWKHYAPTDHRIDPSQTNIIDIFVLTNEYNFLTNLWIANGADIADMPVAPTELDLRLAFSDFDNYKMFSDAIIWRPVQYKFLFGNGADAELQAQFKVVKLPNAPISDGEIKSKVIRAINDYFDVTLWDFGETFYYTELAAYIHQQLVGVIGSIVIVPLSDDATFGEVFEVQCRSDELFLSTAQVSDVVIINSNTASNLRIR